MGSAASTIDSYQINDICREKLCSELQFQDHDIYKAEREIAQLIESSGLSEEEAVNQVVQGYRDLPPIRLISFDAFQKCKEIPRLGFDKSERYPEAPSSANDLVVSLKSIDREDALLCLYLIVGSQDGVVVMPMAMS